MLHEFLRKNRETLIVRSRSKAGSRPRPRATGQDHRYAIPSFLDRVITTLCLEHGSCSPEPGTARVVPPAIEDERSAVDGTSGRGDPCFTDAMAVGQVVRDYGDLCLAALALAIERGESVSAAECRTLYRCLDEAIAHAVMDVARRRDPLAGDDGRVMSERLGSLAHELGDLTGTAMLAVSTIKRGGGGFFDGTGDVLDRTLIAVRDLADRMLVEARLAAASHRAGNGSASHIPAG
jgi:hypothetical protein